MAFSAGGGFDTYTRAIARHIGKYIPGHPNTAVENMTGPGGIIAANYMYRRAEPDGMTIGTNIGGLILQQIMGATAMESNWLKFEYIGVPATSHSVCILTKTSGVTSIDKWFASKEPVKLGGVGPGGNISDVSRILRVALGLPTRVIDGYKRLSEIRLTSLPSRPISPQLKPSPFLWR